MSKFKKWGQALAPFLFSLVFVKFAYSFYEYATWHAPSASSYHFRVETFSDKVVLVAENNKTEYNGIRMLYNVIKKFTGDENKAYDIACSVYYWSWRRNISPILMLAIVAQESAFDDEAISSSGAIGLMQVMPFWAAIYSNEFGIDVDLRKIDDNIMVGSYVLKYYMDRSRSVVDALQKYNASYLSSNAYRYPKRVLRYYRNFRNMIYD